MFGNPVGALSSFQDHTFTPKQQTYFYSMPRLSSVPSRCPPFVYLEHAPWGGMNCANVAIPNGTLPGGQYPCRINNIDDPYRNPICSVNGCPKTDLPDDTQLPLFGSDADITDCRYTYNPDPRVFNPLSVSFNRN